MNKAKIIYDEKLDEIGFPELIDLDKFLDKLHHNAIDDYPVLRRTMGNAPPRPSVRRTSA